MHDGDQHENEEIDRLINDLATDPITRRMFKTRAMARSGHVEAATDELVWLWKNMLEHQQGGYGVRLSFLVSEMHRLAEQDARAKAAFTELRDALNERVFSGDSTRDELTDWMVLSVRVLNDDTTVRAWVDQVWRQPDGVAIMRSEGHAILDWLIHQDEWAKAGLIQRPASVFLSMQRRLFDHLRGSDVPHADRADLKTFAQEQFIETLAVYHAACLAAGREEEAWIVADALMADIPGDSAREALCRTALKARSAQPRHAEIAAEIRSIDSERLGELIRAALDTRA